MLNLRRLDSLKIVQDTGPDSQEMSFMGQTTQEQCSGSSVGGTEQQHLSPPAAGCLQCKAEGLPSLDSHLNQPGSKGSTGFAVLTVKTVCEAVFYPSRKYNTRSLCFSF